MNEGAFFSIADDSVFDETGSIDCPDGGTITETEPNSTTQLFTYQNCAIGAFIFNGSTQAVFMSETSKTITCGPLQVTSSFFGDFSWLGSGIFAMVSEDETLISFDVDATFETGVVGMSTTDLISSTIVLTFDESDLAECQLSTDEEGSPNLDTLCAGLITGCGFTTATCP